MPGLPNERTPLLQETHPVQKPGKDDATGEVARVEEETPIPWGQFSIILILQLAEPVSSCVIYPFVPQLIRETGVTADDDKKVAYYVGMMQSIFFATEAMTVLHWSRGSDRIGRKPVILIGLAGLSLSMFSFGLSKSFPALVISRSLNGLLNGMVGVIKSMVGELTDASNIARAFSYQPISWSTGASVGPLIGGALAHPAERFPNVFGGNKFLEYYPYFLPCAVPAVFCILLWIIAFARLEETNPTGFSFRSLLPRILRGKAKGGADSESRKPVASTIPAAPPLRAHLTPPVIISISCYALLSLNDIAYRALQPVFYSLPRSLGGLELEPHMIGMLLAALGLANGFFQVGCFTRLIKRWGGRTVYLVGLASAIPTVLLFPVMSAVVHAEDRRRAEMSGGSEQEAGGKISWVLGVLVGLQLVLTVSINMCYGCVYIFVTSAANAISLKKTDKSDRSIHPTLSTSSSSATLVDISNTSPRPPPPPPPPPPPQARKSNKTKLEKGPKKKGKKTLGAVNGLAQCTVSVMRCIGPYAASSLFAKGLAWRYGPDVEDEIPVPLPGEGGDGEPIADVMRALVGVGMQEWAGVMQMQVQVEVDMQGAKGGMAWRRMGGMMVYVVMIALVGVTLVVGSRLPDVPWSAAVDDDDDDDDKDGEGEGEAEECHGATKP